MTGRHIEAFLSPLRRSAQENVVWWNGTLQLEATIYLTDDPPPDAYVWSVRGLIIRDRSVLVVRNRDQTHILPGGRRKNDESSTATLRRELLEETGWLVGEELPIGVLHYRHPGPMPPHYPYPEAYPDFLVLVFFATGMKLLTARKTKDDYEREATFLPIEQVSDMNLSACERALLDRVRTIGLCAFCRPEIEGLTLWESEHYRIVADQFPVCEGHLLLMTKAHLSSHMQAPVDWAEELTAAHELMRQFLVHSYGKAAFWENGGARQTVFHAHVHGVPVDLRFPDAWTDESPLSPIAEWLDARREWQRAGSYFFFQSSEGHCYLISETACDLLLNHARRQLVLQTGAQIDPQTGALVRRDADTVARTQERWRQWWLRRSRPHHHRQSPIRINGAQ